eukprot:10859048-Karenia_brevis.AAC.1
MTEATGAAEYLKDEFKTIVSLGHLKSRMGKPDQIILTGTNSARDSEVFQNFGTGAPCSSISFNIVLM